MELYGFIWFNIMMENYLFWNIYLLIKRTFLFYNFDRNVFVTFISQMYLYPYGAIIKSIWLTFYILTIATNFNRLLMSSYKFSGIMVYEITLLIFCFILPIRYLAICKETNYYFSSWWRLNFFSHCCLTNVTF